MTVEQLEIALHFLIYACKTAGNGNRSFEENVKKAVEIVEMMTDD